MLRISYKPRVALFPIAHDIRKRCDDLLGPAVWDHVHQDFGRLRGLVRYGCVNLCPPLGQFLLLPINAIDLAPESLCCGLPCIC